MRLLESQDPTRLAYLGGKWRDAYAIRIENGWIVRYYNDAANECVKYYSSWKQIKQDGYIRADSTAGRWFNPRFTFGTCPEA